MTTSKWEQVFVHHNFEPGPELLDLRASIHVRKFNDKVLVTKIQFFGLKLNPPTFRHIQSTYNYYDIKANHSLFPCMSAHIRRGDKLAEAPPIPTQSYVETIFNLSTLYAGDWSVFVLSDDPFASAQFAEEVSKKFPVYFSNTTAMR